VTIEQLLAARGYPPILRTEDGAPVTRGTWSARRAELRRLLERYSYGSTPDGPVRVSGRTLGEAAVCGGLAVLRRTELTLETEKGAVSFPIEIYSPRAVQRPPVLLHLAFRPVPDRYIPLEAILRAGYALVVAVYTDMMNDGHTGDFSNGIASLFGVGVPRHPDEWGKIGMWAYGASRVLDYLFSDCPGLDAARTAVVGHSRLGKTALWCAALDERFAAAVSNDSGYGGAASSRRGTGERVEDFIRCGSWDWFCERFKDFGGAAEDRKPYDQSFLLAMIAPRPLFVSSASEDAAADPLAEFLTTVHASAAWELLGRPGLILPDGRGGEPPRPGDELIAGNVGYHLRAGRHALMPEDWAACLRFLDLRFGRRSCPAP
jgi:hypothetical protein